MKTNIIKISEFKWGPFLYIFLTQRGKCSCEREKINIFFNSAVDFPFKLKLDTYMMVLICIDFKILKNDDVINFIFTGHMSKWGVSLSLFNIFMKKSLCTSHETKQI